MRLPSGRWACRPAAPARRVVYLYLAVGGALGTIARFGVGGWIETLAAEGFPWPTFGVNIAGSLLLGTIIGYEQLGGLSADMRALIAVGFCGAFTTFSTFSLETFSLLQRGETARAAVYALGSVLLGLIGVFAGFHLGTSLAR